MYSYQMRCLPLGIARTALTGPLTLGNLKVLLGSRRPLCKLYSSTDPFLLPAYIKLPSGDQQAFMHHGGVLRVCDSRATGFDCRRSHMRNVPSIDASKKVVSEEMGCSAWPNELPTGFSMSSACGKPFAVAVDCESDTPFVTGSPFACASGSFTVSSACSLGACTGPPMSISSRSPWPSSSACWMPLAIARERQGRRGVVFLAVSKKRVLVAEERIVR
jgi:hypothetical protein